ncbi:voltage-dependent T-type calcium channel subunit alpha-1H-like protein [Lates japonicus]|uniref:Voltage-dependent T-type calcium channel subunit alpha-1H-like protein n=1 Tax=Lates japonicus TaxID=270547 RepID=A0AAD3N1S1_LATJO|nr:voltage-dependent T-type calcium channel subunit alpha-1H-like protein [Lates japonicus]
MPDFRSPGNGPLGCHDGEEGPQRLPTRKATTPGGGYLQGSNAPRRQQCSVFVTSSPRRPTRATISKEKEEIEEEGIIQEERIEKEEEEEEVVECEQDDDGSSDTSVLVVPYPELVPVVFFCLKQTTCPRSWCIRMVSSPYPFYTVNDESLSFGIISKSAIF